MNLDTEIDDCLSLDISVFPELVFLEAKASFYSFYSLRSEGTSKAVA
jgi:hypothetical protein